VEAALAMAGGQVGVILEVKAPGIGPTLNQVVQASGFVGEVIYASFLHVEILEIRRIDPSARTMALMECVPLSGAAFARDAGASLVGLGHDSATAEFIATLREAGLVVMLYTVNGARMVQRAVDLGADGIISDYPEDVPKVRS
jgi:glycerophosphoryl diester phosphodiesterase